MSVEFTIEIGGKLYGDEPLYADPCPLCGRESGAKGRMAHNRHLRTCYERALAKLGYIEGPKDEALDRHALVSFTPPSRRSQFLTPATERILQIMVYQEEELIGDAGEWFAGDHRTNAKAVYALLRHCLIRRSTFGGGCEIYHANEESRAILEDPDYVPMLYRALAEDREAKA